MFRACLMAEASRCWCGEQTPVKRRGTILPLSATNWPSSSYAGRTSVHLRVEDRQARNARRRHRTAAGLLLRNAVRRRKAAMAFRRPVLVLSLLQS